MRQVKFPPLEEATRSKIIFLEFSRIHRHALLLSIVVCLFAESPMLQGE
jgi:hypothetical protein